MFRNKSEGKRKFDRLNERFWTVFEYRLADDASTRSWLDAELAKLRSDMALARAEYRKAMMRDRQAAFEAARAYRNKFGAWPDSDKGDRKRRRRRPGGTEPVPVEPHPKPKPLMDGAEAPIK